MLHLPLVDIDLQPCLDLLCCLAQRVVTLPILTPHLLEIFFGYPLRHDSRVVAEPACLRNLLVTHTGIRILPSISPLVDRHNHSSAKTQVVLQRHIQILDEPSIIRPPTQLPAKLRTLRQPRCSQWMPL